MTESSLNIHYIDSESLQKLQNESENDKKSILKQFQKLKELAAKKSSSCDRKEKEIEDESVINCIETLFIFDVDDTLSPTTSIISKLYDQNGDNDDDEINLSENDALSLRQIEDSVVDLLDHIKGPGLNIDENTSEQNYRLHDTEDEIFKSSWYSDVDHLIIGNNKIMLRNRILLVTAAGKDGFLAVCKHLPKFRQFLIDNQIKVWVNDYVEANDSIGKLNYKKTVFEHEIFQTLAQEQKNRISNFDDSINSDTIGSNTRNQLFKSLLLISIGDGTCEQDAMFSSTSTLLELLNEKKKSKTKMKNILTKSKIVGISDLPRQNYDTLYLGSIVIKLREEEDLEPKHILVQLQNLKSLFSVENNQTASLQSDTCDKKDDMQQSTKFSNHKGSDAKAIFSLESIVDIKRVTNCSKVTDESNQEIKDSRSRIRENISDKGSPSIALHQQVLPGFYRSVPPDLEDSLINDLFLKYMQVFNAEYIE